MLLREAPCGGSRRAQQGTSAQKKRMEVLSISFDRWLADALRAPAQMSFTRQNFEDILRRCMTRKQIFDSYENFTRLEAGLLVP